MSVFVPPLTGAHAEAWSAILDLADRLPQHWSLVGGQMVLVHCWDRGAQPVRPTEDADVIVDVRARPDMLAHLTGALVDLGFTSAGSSPSGHEHRWLRGQAVVDVLLPDGIGPRAAGRTGVTGSTSLLTPGGTQVLLHSAPMTVTYDGRTAVVPVPHLPGALLAKARAWGNTLDVDRTRHVLDLAVLSTLASRRDNVLLAEVFGPPKPRRALASALRAMTGDPLPWTAVPGAADAVPRLLAFLVR